MRLEDNFYTVVSSLCTTEGYEVSVELKKDHQIYQGHFPGQPIVPGVCTLTIIREQLSRLIGKPLMFAAIKGVKYVGMIVPEEGLKVHLRMTMDGNDVKCTAIRKEETVLKLSASVREI